MKPHDHMETLDRLTAARTEAKKDLAGSPVAAKAGGEEAPPLDGQREQTERGRAQAHRGDEADLARQWLMIFDLIGSITQLVYNTDHGSQHRHRKRPGHPS